MAVDQVELPTTVSNMENPRQISVVNAIRSESSTFRTLDHSSIVQYLGIQETEKYLIMCVNRPVKLVALIC